jgi:hypothetical protein
MLRPIFSQKEDATEHGLCILKRVNRLEQMDFNPHRLTECDQDWLAIFLAVAECPSGTLESQRVGGKIQLLNINSTVNKPRAMGGIAEQVAVRIKSLVARGKRRAESEKLVLIFLVERVIEVLGWAVWMRKRARKQMRGLRSML